MADPTEEDRQRANAIVAGLHDEVIHSARVALAIAQALAEERLRTVLAVAEQSKALFERAQGLCDRADANFKIVGELAAKAARVADRKERAAVVAWLRSHASLPDRMVASITYALADEIERGEHLK